MWHEARKQEKKIKGLMVDYRRRAERRRNFYERIKADPTQFMQIHGRPYKIHLDPGIAQAADSPANMMPWQGDKENLIDRFDVRAHLDHIPDNKRKTQDTECSSKEDSLEDRQANYERYRILVQSDFLGISEEKFLNQIFLEERYGGSINKSAEEEKKKLSEKKAAIGYVYEDSTAPSSFTTNFSNQSNANESDEEDNDDSDIDLDITVEFEKLNSDQRGEMNLRSVKYGMIGDDFVSHMEKDKDEVEALRLARELEEEKAMYSGRKSRRERRAFREKRLQGRKISPPSYAAKESPTYEPYKRSTSRSKSRSPENCGEITFITSFGDEAENTVQNNQSSSNVSIDKENRNKDGPKVKKEYGPQLLKSSSSSSKSHRSRSSRSPKHCRSRSPRRSRSRGRYTSKHSKCYSSGKRRSSSSSDRSSRRYRSRSPKDRSKSRSTRSESGRYNRRSRSPDQSRWSSRKEKSYGNRHSARNSSGEGKPCRKRGRRSSSPSSSEERKYSSKTRNKSNSPQSPRSLINSSQTSSHSSSSTSSSSSKSRSKQENRSKSGSHSPLPVKRYRRNSKSLSPKTNSEEYSSDESVGNSNKSSQVNLKSLSKGDKSAAIQDSKAIKLTPQERLKRKVQLALNKQYKADKIAEQKKILQQEKIQRDREEELREMSLKLRRKNRERRHADMSQDNSDYSSSSSDDSSSSDSESRSPSPIDT